MDGCASTPESRECDIRFGSNVSRRLKSRSIVSGELWFRPFGGHQRQMMVAARSSPQRKRSLPVLTDVGAEVVKISTGGA